MGNYELIRKKELTDNPTARVPVCICIDTSGSMGAIEGGDFRPTGERVFCDGQWWDIATGGVTRIDELQKGIEKFYNAVRSDEVAVYSTEICIVEFNDSAKCVVDYANIYCQPEIPKLIATGETAMGEGVNLALDLLEKRKNEYKDAGVDYYQPWLVLMTDGYPNGNAQELERAVERTVELVNMNKITVFPIGIGKESDMNTLNRFSPKRSALRLQGLKFEELFSWLSSSIIKVSQSTPGERITLDFEGIKGWGEL